MSAAALLAEAAAAGVTLALARDGMVRATGPASPELVARLRARKPELVQLLRGYRCRHCGEVMGWPGPVGLVLADGTAAHHRCDARAEAGGVRRHATDALSPEALADPAIEHAPRCGGPSDALPQPAGGYGTILADPPWRFANRTGKVAPEHRRLARYATMALEEIAAMPVADASRPRLAPVPVGAERAAARGAGGPGGLGLRATRPTLVWYKVRTDGGPDGRGVGFYFRNVTEILLFGVRGRNARTLAAGRRQVNLIATRKREHSRKPDELYPIIEACSPGPYLELFARHAGRGGTPGATRSDDRAGGGRAGMTDLVRAAKLRAEISARTGGTYYAGRMGGCRVLVLEDTDEREGEPSHWLMLSEAEPALPSGQRELTARPPGRAPRPQAPRWSSLLRRRSRRPGVTGPRLAYSHRAAWRPAGERGGLALQPLRAVRGGGAPGRDVRPAPARAEAERAGAARRAPARGTATNEARTATEGGRP